MTLSETRRTAGGASQPPPTPQDSPGALLDTWPLSLIPSEPSDSVPTSIVSKRALVSGTILVAESFVRLGLVAALSFWIARTLGPAEFGILNYVSAVVAVFLSLATLGMETPVVLRLTQSKDPGLILGSAVALRAISGLVCALLVFLAVLLMRSGQHLSVVVAAISALSIPLSASSLVDCWFKERNDALPPAIARIVATILSCAAKAACLWAGLGVVALAWTIALEAAAMSMALTWTYLKVAKGEVPRVFAIGRETMQSLLRESWPYVISITAIAAYMKIDVILLGLLSTDRETGIYSLCQKISEVLYILPVVVVDVLYPALARNQAGIRAQPTAATQSFFDLTMAVSLIATVLAIGAVTWLVPHLFGEQYRNTADIFHIHAWSCIGITMAHARYKWLAASGLQRYAPTVTLIGLALSVALNVQLIPLFGGWGAATATVISYTTSGFLLSFTIPSLRPVARLQARSLWPWFRLAHDYRMRGRHAG